MLDRRSSLRAHAGCTDRSGWARPALAGAAHGGEERRQLRRVLVPGRGLGAAGAVDARTVRGRDRRRRRSSPSRPPLRISGTFERRARSSSQSNVSPVPPRMPVRARRARARVEQVEVDVEALEVAHVAGAGDLRRLDHARAGAPATSRAEGGALVAVQLDHASARARRSPRRSRSSGALTNTPHSSARRRSAAAIAAASLGRAAARAALVEDHARAPRRRARPPARRRRGS